MSRASRYHKRQEKRRKVFFSSLKNDEIAEYNPETKQVEVTKLVGRIHKFEGLHLAKRPNFADVNGLDAGSAAEKRYLDTRMRQGLPRYHDRKTDTIIN